MSFEQKNKFQDSKQRPLITKQQLGLRRKSDIGLISGGLITKISRIGNIITHSEKFNQQMIGLIFGNMRSSNDKDVTRGFLLAIAWFVRIKNKSFEQYLVSDVRFQQTDMTFEQSAHLDMKPISLFRSEQYPDRHFRFSVFPTDKIQSLGKSSVEKQFLVNEKKYDQMVYNICKVRKGIEVSAVEPVLQYSKTNIYKSSYVTKRTGIAKNRKEDDLELLKPRSVSSEMVNPEEPLEDNTAFLHEKNQPLNTISRENTIVPRLQMQDMMDFETGASQKNSPKLTTRQTRPTAGKNNFLNRSSSKLPTVIASMEEKSRRKSRVLLDLPEINRGLQVNQLSSSPKETNSSVKKEFSTQQSFGQQDTSIKLKETYIKSAPKLRDFLLSNIVSSQKWIATKPNSKKIQDIQLLNDKQIPKRQFCNPYAMKSKIKTSNNTGLRNLTKKSILSTTRDFIINIK